MNLSIHQGDCLEVLRTLPDSSVQCCVTSPPYWGLRDYGVAGQMGLEETFAEYLAKMVAVFREVRRVLREDGTAWVNMGDSYAGSWGAQGRQGQGMMLGRSVVAARQIAQAQRRTRTGSTDRLPEGVKSKDLIGQPWRLAFALQEDGWWLRQDIIWHKPNPMPESIRDRCTKAHEYLFLLTKSERYYWDFEAIQEPVSPNTHARLSQHIDAQAGSARAHGGTKVMKAVGRKVYSGSGVGFGRGFDRISKPRVKNNDSFDSAMAIMPTSRNRRSVWTIPTEAYSDAHFATFPTALVTPCILAGTRPGDTVIDPFGGSGTTGRVALELGRAAVLIELNPAYVRMIGRRTNVTPGLPLS